MQDSTQQGGGGGQQLDASYPAPPDHFSLFTDANIQRMADTDREAAMDDPELKFLAPPPPPQSGTYTVFGRMWHVRDELPTLAEQNITQLYPDGQIDRVAELKRLNRSVIFEFLDLVDVLVKDPSQFAARTERIRDVFVNIHHLINEYREHQAKETLKLMIRQQIDGKRQATERTLAKCTELEQTIERLRLEAADTKTEISEANQSIGSDSDGDSKSKSNIHGGARQAQITQSGLAKIAEAVQALT
ncbi:Mediator of RNA polymerase II transcription subunit 7 [Coemansia erecta]|nr:Mediator of RNA polymerase II transcription subunit 7 [Coemansia sp. RSA 2618]KAJ2824858.1 Mediator of RNA polymerase II transcription subunit 7 [Coemansia erecta]